MNAHPAPSADLNAVLHELVMSAQAVLGANSLATYLQGSFAAGGFDIQTTLNASLWTIRGGIEAGSMELIRNALIASSG